MMEEKLPKGWEVYPLIELLDLLETGSRPKGGVQGIFDGIPSLGGEHLDYNGGFKFDKLKFIPLEFAKKMKRGKINEGDVLIVKDGATTGKTSYVDESFPFDEAYVNEHVFICRPNKNHSGKFISFFLRSKEGQKRILENFTGSAQGGINQKFAQNTKVPLPPLPEQQRIVAKLDALFGHLDSLREKLDWIPTLLKNFRQQVLTQAVTGELTKEWREGKGLGEWERVQLGKLGKWVGGGTPSKSEPAFWNNGEVLWITPKDMKSIFVSDSLDKITSDAVEKSSTKLVPSNSILIVTRSGILRRILPISLNAKEATVNQDLKVLIPKKEVYPKFLLYSLIGLEENIRINCMKSGTTVESIEFSDLKGYSLGVPTFKEQEEIVRKVEALFSLADKIESQYASLKAKIDQLPQAILAKAFRGELVGQEVKE